MTRPGPNAKLRIDRGTGTQQVTVSVPMSTLQDVDVVSKETNSTRSKTMAELLVLGLEARDAKTRAKLKRTARRKKKKGEAAE